MEVDERTPPNPGRRVLGYSVGALGVLVALSALVGWPASSRGDRLVLVVVALALLGPGAFWARATMPGADSVSADETGLVVVVTAGSRGVTLPWADVDAVWLRAVTSVLGTRRYLLRLQFRGAAPRPEALRVFEGYAESGLGELLIGLTGDQELALRRSLPAAAGERFGIRE